MARKPNYGFEKRQKELTRKAKKEEKKQRKLAGMAGETEPAAEAEETPWQGVEKPGVRG
jgi:hypothetical protein